MALELDRDLGVDVLIIGGGIEGLYLARALRKTYSVCIVTNPASSSETLDSPGYFSAGYDGNDVARIQPARRAAGYWRLWAESNGVVHDPAPAYYVMTRDQEMVRTRLWADATLIARPAPSLPEVFTGGSLDGSVAYFVDNDVVINPTALVATLGDGLQDCILPGEVTKFGVITERAIDFVEVQTTSGQTAANADNGGLLQRLVGVFKDRSKRKHAVEVMRGCQAVRRQLTLVLRGDLPAVAGHFERLDITAHPAPDGGYVWIVRPPIDDRQTVLGPEEFRFEPKVEPRRVVEAIDRLFEVAPDLRDRAAALEWSAYVARKTEHPMMAVPDTSAVAQPAPARLETLEMEGFVAVWPSHLSYAMIVGDVVAERVQSALGPAARYPDSLQPRDVSPPPNPGLARWERPTFPWRDWTSFAAEVDYPKP
jgi:glycine/D-amino acid oxidase-like deaminating enzyme